MRLSVSCLASFVLALSAVACGGGGSSNGQRRRQRERVRRRMDVHRQFFRE
jgi:hypothetical protein